MSDENEWYGKTEPPFVLSLGYCGPTDCMLALTHNEATKEYGIDSTGWKALSYLWSYLWDIKSGGSVKFNQRQDAWHICKIVWDNRDEDARL